MSTTRFTDGPVTVTLSGDLEALVRRALDAAAGEAVRLMEGAAEEVAAKARADWYAQGTGVTRRTGKSGQVEVVTTVSADQVRVSVGSSDLDKAKYVHRPGRLATRPVEIDAGAYRRAKEAGSIQADLVFHARRNDPAEGVQAGRYYRREADPNASDGRFLLVELIRKPARAKVKALAPELGRAIAARAGGA